MEEKNENELLTKFLNFIYQTENDFFHLKGSHLCFCLINLNEMSTAELEEVDDFKELFSTYDKLKDFLHDDLNACLNNLKFKDYGQRIIQLIIQIKKNPAASAAKLQERLEKTLEATTEILNQVDRVEKERNQK